MIRTIKYTTVIAAAMLAAACSNHKSDMPQPQPQPHGDMPISFAVEVKDDNATRALIQGETNEALSEYSLEEACTPVTDGGLGYAVGLYGDYSYMYNGRPVTVHDVFHGTRLTYFDKPNGNPYNSLWNYETDDMYWFMGGQYVFRAYFPQRLAGYTISTSNATTFAIVYPSRKLQEDLMVGYTTVDTTEPGITGKAVEITMKHALAALRFKFRLSFVGEDYLTSCYLLNDEGESYFTQGSLVYGADPANGIYDPENIMWKQDYNPPPTEVLYKWALSEGLYIESSYDAQGGFTSTEVTAYTQPEGQTVETGELYCQNNGWLLIPPQKSYGKLTLCFTTKLGGEAIYKVALPEVTEKKPVLGDDGKPTYDADGELVTEPVSTEWKAGYRYTYTVTISHSDLYATIDILDWNYRNHSTQIGF